MAAIQTRDVTNQVRGNQASGVPGEFHLGETVRLYVSIMTTTETFTVAKTFHLYREGQYQFSVGSGEAISIVPNVPKTIIQDWPATLASSQFGHWRAEFNLPGQTLVALFDLDHAPDFEVTYLGLDHDPFLIDWAFARDGTHKYVSGCVYNRGPDQTPANAVAGLYFRNHATLDNYPVVQRKTVMFGYPTPRCTDLGIAAAGWYVEFDWEVLNNATMGSVPMYRVGIRADPYNYVWETVETNNAREAESTILPIIR